MAVQISIDSLFSIDNTYEWLSKYDLNEPQLKELLDRSREHVFSMGVEDAAAQIGEVISQLFVAKMLYVQNRLDLSQYASVIQPPDATIQTYHLKFIRCVPEAAKIRWNRNPEGVEFIPAEVDVDFCGMICIGMKENLTSIELAENIASMKERLKTLDGRPLDTNCIQPGTHFANIYSVRDYEHLGLPPYVGVAHLASDEYREELREIARKEAIEVPTPFGVCLAILDGSAQRYWELAQEGSLFSQRKRVLIAKDIFRSDQILSNKSHYEMISPSSCVTGCNAVRNEQEYHIIASTASSEAYLVKGRRGLSRETIRETGRVLSDSLCYELLESSILPHGTGHALIEDEELQMVFFTPHGILFRTKLFGGGERIVYHYHTVPTMSRRSVFSNVIRYGLIHEDYARLQPLCSVKV